MRTIKIFQNASTGAIFNEDGSPLENALTPFVRFPESVLLDYNAINSDDVADAYTGWTGETITAEAIIDNDFDHYISGVLTGAKSGAVTAIAATIADASYVNPTGTLQLVNAAGESETVAYTAFALVSGVYTFTVSATLTYSYAISDECNVADVPLAASYAVDYTNKDTGRLLFSLSVNSRPLYALLSGNASLADCVMAVQVYTADGSDPDTDPDIVFAQEFELGVFNIRKYSQAIPPPMNGDYYTKAEVLAIFGGYMELAATPTDGNLLTTDATGQAEDSGIPATLLASAWHPVTYAATVTLDVSDGFRQKIVCTGVIDITPPTLSASAPNLDLQISTGGYAISVSSAEIIATGDSKIYLISWYWDGATTRRKTAVEVF